MIRYELSYLEEYNPANGTGESFIIMNTSDKSKIDELCKKYGINAINARDHKYEDHVFLIAEYEIKDEFRQDQLELALQADAEYKKEQEERAKARASGNNWWDLF